MPHHELSGRAPGVRGVTGQWACWVSSSLLMALWWPVTSDNISSSAIVRVAAVRVVTAWILLNGQCSNAGHCCDDVCPMYSAQCSQSPVPGHYSASRGHESCRRHNIDMSFPHHFLPPPMLLQDTLEQWWLPMIGLRITPWLPVFWIMVNTNWEGFTMFRLKFASLGHPAQYWSRFLLFYWTW